jgi:hypothetical protein
MIPEIIIEIANQAILAVLVAAGMTCLALVISLGVIRLLSRP